MRHAGRSAPEEAGAACQKKQKKKCRAGNRDAGGVHDSQNNHEKTAFPAGQTEAAAALQEGRGNKNRKGKKGGYYCSLRSGSRYLAGGGAYAAMAQKYKKVFFPNTIINGMNASGRTVAEVKEMIAGGIENYV